MHVTGAGVLYSSQHSIKSIPMLDDKNTLFSKQFTTVTYDIGNPREICQFSVPLGLVSAMGKLRYHILFLLPRYLTGNHREPLLTCYQKNCNKVPAPPPPPPPPPTLQSILHVERLYQFTINTYWGWFKKKLRNLIYYNNLNMLTW